MASFINKIPTTQQRSPKGHCMLFADSPYGIITHPLFFSNTIPWWPCA